MMTVVNTSALNKEKEAFWILLKYLNRFRSESTTPEPWKVVEEEINPEYWQKEAEKFISAACKRFPILKSQKPAKNVILFLGDGMGVPTIAASRFYLAHRSGLNGSMLKHPFEDWPFSTVARTYDLETVVTDSASSANAYLTGTKTRTGMIGVTGKLHYKQCGAWPAEEFTHSVLEAASKAGKATGILTTTRITHASPSGCYGHVTYRDFEGDVNLKEVCGDEFQNMPCQDLSCQLIHNNRDINVMIGGGAKNFYPFGKEIPNQPGNNGTRLDQRDLVNDWMKYQKKQGRKHKYISSAQEFNAADFNDTDYLLCMPYPDHMPYTDEKRTDEPNLMRYIQAAIKILQRNKNGFFLFVEGGRIDHAHHTNEGRHAMDEMLEFDKAIEAAMELVNMDETLMIVTADHSHSFGLFGRPSRFHSILDLDNGYSSKTLDKQSMTAMGYLTGPAGLTNKSRSDPAQDDIYSWKYKQQSLVPLFYSTHGGDDVGVYATGPFSRLFTKTIDNTFISQAMKYAMGVEPYDSVEPSSESTSKNVLPILTNEISPKYWERQARECFATAAKMLPDMADGAKKAKNVIMFLGDGMGLSTISAGRFYADETTHIGKPVKFSFEDWDFNTLARTYDLQTMVTDSASTKTRTGMVGVTGAINVKECVEYNDTVKTISVLKAAAKAGKGTGIVTTARVTHASPSGAFGHSASRHWESDADIAKDCKKSCECMDLAQQLVLHNLDINVILGGGQSKFYPKTNALPIDTSMKGERDDGKVLPRLWLEAQKEKGRKAKYVGTVKEFNSIDVKQTDYLMGLLAASHLPYVLDRPTGDPSLTDLTAKAIEILQKNPEGFFLFVEGGRIDHGHHANKAK
ncbi:unnamed protein product [Schistocephalus solidus]|uniref:alkaline phosphatase n=1 Tax=Schistocephalus solidus TaxID=70667 RepID=A0A183TA13_SCHSO|nr:unnamed protein product [Schistocephalus solidus]